MPHPTATVAWPVRALRLRRPRRSRQATDAARAAKHAYERHLLVKETNRNGLSFYFQYDGWAERDCVRTWGDDGIYDHVIYLRQGRRHAGDNRLGHVTYRGRAGQVVAISDALGGETKYATMSARQKVSETDAAGGETK